MGQRRTLKTYGIEEHSHRFAAWTAGRAASVNGCRFSVQAGKDILEHTGLSADLLPPRLPKTYRQMQITHREWRKRACTRARQLGVKNFSHGIAAKLINVYLKSRFVCGGKHSQATRYVPPPIDGILLRALADKDVGHLKVQWMELGRRRWSKLDSTEYERAVSLIRQAMGKRALWLVEEHWRGHQ